MIEAAANRGRLIVVSNRLPLKVDVTDGGGFQVTPGSGGLVTALAPVMRQRGGIWVGWPGGEIADGLVDEFTAAGVREGYAFRPVHLDQNDHEAFYYGFSNEIIWPLFHDLQSHCNFDPEYWRAYQRVADRYAEVITANASPADFIWVHDYQLMGVGERVRSSGVGTALGFFLHIPFPPPDIFATLPWREEILRSLLAYDLVGFQTRRDRRNFLDCLRDLLPEVEVTGRGQPLVRIRVGERLIRVGSFPIGIDYNDFFRRASAPGVVSLATGLREQLLNRQLLLGIDRLDYTKGIPERLRAFGKALDCYPELRERVTLIQVVVPSRAEIPQYQALKATIENLVGQINGRFTRPGGWVPIHYVYRDLTQEQLLSYYRAAQIALITPLKDGMNLVAKEYCAASPDEDCVLILSEFAGAAFQLKSGALTVNPHDIDGVASAIHTAFLMPPSERRARMRRMRRSVRRHDLYAWVESFLRAAAR